MTESVHGIRSEALGNERPVWIVEPRHPQTARGLLVFLDGEMYRDHLHATATVHALVDQRLLADCWLVYVSYLDLETRARECPCHPPFARFVAGELLDFLESTEPRLRATRPRVLIGLSYTGLAAAYVVHEFPGRFQKVIAQSGSFWSNDCWLAGRYAGDPATVPTEFYLEVGCKETQTNVRHGADLLQPISQIEGVTRFRDALQSRGYRVHYAESEGSHEYSNWAESLPTALRWALPPEAR